MRRAIEHYAAGDWPKAMATDSLTLPFDDRHRRRIRLASDGGAPVLLDLKRTAAMGDGDGLYCDDGAWLAVRAAPETLIEIACADAHALARIAWHLGNRHLPTQLAGGAILIRPDHVIEEMVRGLGATTRAIVAPFQPEGGAYGQAAHVHFAGEARHAS
jgi:urease accessory protein